MKQFTSSRLNTSGRLRPPPRIGRWLFLLAAMALTAGLFAACGGNDDDDADTAANGENGDATDDGSDSAAADVTPAADTLIVVADVVRGPEAVPESMRGSLVCVPDARFPRGSELVWRFKVYDPATGEQMDDTEITSAVVELPTGEALETRYGDHPSEEPTDVFWTTSWEVPMDYPTGQFDWNLRVEDSHGRTGEFEMFNVESSLTTIVEQDDSVVPEAEEES